MDLKLKNKVAFIGGGSKGLGKNCALQLAKEQVHIVICAREIGTLNQTAEEIKKITRAQVLPMQVDFAKTEDIKNAVNKTLQKFGKIDILVVNSGGPKSGEFFEFSKQDWQTAFISVLYYAIELYKLILPTMIKQKWGRVINIGSLSIKEPADNLILSSVFRTGLASLAKTLSKKLIQNNITINTVCPGAFKTDRALQLIRDESKKTGLSIKQTEQNLTRNLPLQRFQHPDEIGTLVAFLASDLASGITGTTIQVDHGMQKFLF